jgi:hypothetical protein|tara:strand:+ start:501 stop:710 length:210 start_codon:yes stop_codon:yes gene_type:complete
MLKNFSLEDKVKTIPCNKVGIIDSNTLMEISPEELVLDRNNPNIPKANRIAVILHLQGALVGVLLVFGN